MQIDLKNFFVGNDKEMEIDCMLDLSKEKWQGQYPFAKPVKVKGTIKKLSGMLTLDGMIEYYYSAACDRCASNCEAKMTAPTRHVLVQDLDQYDSEDAVELKNYMLDLRRVALDDILLSLPMLFLCAPDCKGLCSRCGKNLNVDSCVCENNGI